MVNKIKSENAAQIQAAQQDELLCCFCDMPARFVAYIKSPDTWCYVCAQHMQIFKVPIGMGVNDGYVIGTSPEQRLEDELYDNTIAI